MPDISNKMLTQTLRSLEKAGLVGSYVHAVVPPKAEYSPSGLGKKLEPMLVKVEKILSEKQIIEEVSLID
jgi:DNA-binding HxlR family transcriptional regulator